jgi:three-Cys-motif partner protein
MGVPPTLPAGFSGEYTPEKQRQFRRFMAVHARVSASILKRNAAWAYPRYAYIDLHAGPGRDVDGNAGSPVIAAEELRMAGVCADLYLCERDARTVQRLTSCMAAEYSPDINSFVLEGDHAQSWRRISAEYGGQRPPVYGMIYADSNGQPLPVDVLRSLLSVPRFRCVDVLLHINANGAYKRARHLHPDRFLADDLAAIGQGYAWIREPRTDWQWTFVIWSRWPRFPKFGGDGFHDLSKADGQAILDRPNLSQRERRHQQRGLFDAS